MPTVIVKCTCESKFQDEQHGYKMRVASTMKEMNKTRCTVCGAVKEHFVVLEYNPSTGKEVRYRLEGE